MKVAIAAMIELYRNLIFWKRKHKESHERLREFAASKGLVRVNGKWIKR